MRQKQDIHEYGHHQLDIAHHKQPTENRYEEATLDLLNFPASSLDDYIEPYDVSNEANYHKTLTESYLKSRIQMPVLTVNGMLPMVFVSCLTDYLSNFPFPTSKAIFVLSSNLS